MVDSSCLSPLLPHSLIWVPGSHIWVGEDFFLAHCPLLAQDTLATSLISCHSLAGPPHAQRCIPQHSLTLERPPHAGCPHRQELSNCNPLPTARTCCLELHLQCVGDLRPQVRQILRHTFLKHSGHCGTRRPHNLVVDFQNRQWSPSSLRISLRCVHHRIRIIV